MTTVKILKENEQDFEWYPTTQEIIECVKNTLMHKLMVDTAY